MGWNKELEAEERDGNKASVGGRYVRHCIGWAVKQMWNGQAVCRDGWNGRGQHIRLQIRDANSRMTQPYVYITTMHGELVPWLASQSDLLAIDWQLYEEPANF